ncbi:MAG: sigma-70 family RNA polymerase sigma factor [Dehalococcoidia bacterium]
MEAAATSTEQADQLAARAQNGDLAAFNELVLTYQQQVYNLALRMLSSPAAAEDVTQDAFISAYRRIDTYRGGNFKAWLLRIATNACYDVLRQRGRRPATSLDGMFEESDAPPIADPHAASPELEAERKEVAAAVQRALSQIPADQRAAIILCDLQGLAYEEIAVTLDVNIGTVKSRINRGRARLRELLTSTGELRGGQVRPKSEPQ